MPRTTLPSRTPVEETQIVRFKELTETLLPELASARAWPIRLDHCFKRICLDQAFGDVWYHHLPKPAERHLRGEPLRRAVQFAEELLAGGEELLRQRNVESLGFRGKIRGGQVPKAGATGDQ